MATKQEIRDYFAKFGREGGKTRAKNMTAVERAESARKASQARWKKIDTSIAEMESNLKALVKLNRTNARKKKKAKESL